MHSQTWPAKITSLDSIQEFIASVAQEAGVDSKRSVSITLIVEEIAVNIINYAYKDDEPGDITVSVDFTPLGEEISISFADTGTPFNPLEKEPPDINQDIMERRIGGLGIFMVREIADDVTYTRCCSKNILTVKVNKHKSKKNK
ncbi:MAG: ATP-binding protein [Desulfamplus sp.]|nr:ATP-binding protein [Desulfamplus sp.]